MPEGDTILRTAVTLRRLVEGRAIVRASGRDDVSFDPATLAGRVVTDVESRGKHLLVHVDDGRAVHSHLGMTGSWHVYGADSTWNKPRRRAGLVLEFDRVTAVCFSPKTLELLSSDGLRRHAMLRRLGPDLLAAVFDEAEVVRRFRAVDDRPVGEAILDQSVLCGVGNVYKSEVLFLERVDPFASVRELSDERLRGVVRRARSLARRNLEGRARRTRFGADGQRKWVYGRSGEPCLECGSRIAIRRQGSLGRTTYWCPECQGDRGRR